jgi:hypothetical protein
MDWGKLAERFWAAVAGGRRLYDAQGLDLERWARRASDAELDAWTVTAADLLPIQEGAAAKRFTQLIKQAEIGLIEDVLQKLGRRELEAAVDVARIVDGQRRAVALIDDAVSRGAVAAMELKRRRSVAENATAARSPVR